MTRSTPDQLLLDSYRSWLLNRHLSPSTVKNYTSDLSRYFQTLNSQNPFSYPALINYLQQINADSSYPRYLASLNLFCQFGLDQKLITTNPLITIKRNSNNKSKLDISTIISNFGVYLNHLKTPSSTVKNYLNDLNLYLHWLKNNPPHAS